MALNMKVQQFSYFLFPYFSFFMCSIAQLINQI